MSLNSHGNALPEGYRLLWYRIGCVLGQGGFGITYEALDTNLDKSVAIKEYLPKEFAVRENDSTVHPFTEDRKQMFEWGLERFIQEARTLAKFKHPNIVQVYNVFEENGTAYMVMEFEQGEALDRLFKFGHIEKESDLLRIAHPPAGRYRTHTRSRIHPSRHQASQHLRAPGWLPGVAGFRLGPFCHRRRDQDTDEFGIGHIVAIDNELLTCNVTFLPDQREVIYQKEQLVELELAYAITIHKAQGSEFAIVIIPLLTQHFKMLYRNLIYTGLTRARKLVVVVGSRRALAMAVRQQDTRLRQTALQYLLSGDN